MYGVKRVAESTGYALTFGEQAKARRHLEQAQRRLDEVEGMVTRDQVTRASGAPVDPAEQELVRSTMQEFDTDANEGSRLLLSGPADPAQVDDVRQWAAEQSARLEGMRSTIPAQDKADESLALLDRLLGEAQAALAGVRPGPRTVPHGGRRRPGRRHRGDRALARSRRRGAALPGATDDHTRPGTTIANGDGSSADDDRRRARARPTTNRPRTGTAAAAAGSGGSGGSGGGDAAGSDDQLSVPLPLPAPVKVPSVVPGLPGVSLGG